MKAALFLFIITLNARAEVSFSWIRSTPQGQDKVELSEKAGRLGLTKNSNWFLGEDQRIGSFKLENNSASHRIVAELNEVEKDLNRANNLLKAHGKGLNQLNTTDNPHSPQFRLGEFIVKAESPVYSRLEKLALEVLSLPMALTDGVELSKDKKKYVFYKKGAVSSEEPFDQGFFCNTINQNARCLARQWGQIYLK